MSQKVAAWRTEELALLKVKPSWIETIKDEQKRFCTTGLLWVKDIKRETGQNKLLFSF